MCYTRIYTCMRMCVYIAMCSFYLIKHRYNSCFKVFVSYTDVENGRMDTGVGG